MNTPPAHPDPPYYVKGLALGIPAILIGLQLTAWIYIIPAIRDGHSDFRQLYTAAYMVRTGHAHELYDYRAQKHFQDTVVSPAQIALPFIRPASQALLFTPLSLFRYRTAYVIFAAINLVLLAVSFRLLRPMMNNIASIYRWLPAAMFATYLPIAAALMQGQDSILLLALLCGAFVALRKRRDLPAGILTGLGLFKFQIVLPLALLLFIWRRWSFLAGFAISSAVIVAASIWLVGVPQTMVLQRSLIGLSTGTNQNLVAAAAHVPLRIATYATRMPNLRGLIFSLTDRFLPPYLIQTMTIAASLAVFLWVAITARNTQHQADMFLIALLTSALVSYYFFIHDFSVTLIPIAVLLNRFVQAEWTEERGKSIARASAFVFAAPALTSFLPVDFYVLSIPACILLAVISRRGALDSYHKAMERFVER